MRIFDSAKKYMTAHGNETQWGDGYPGVDILKNDIINGDSYVLSDNGKLVGTFTLVFGEEPTYNVIKNGEWNFDKPYGTIHRLASDGTVRGIARACFEYCFEKTDYLRIDTHENNIAMRAAIESFGFKKCGNIYVRNRSERIAYDCLKA